MNGGDPYGEQQTDLGVGAQSKATIQTLTATEKYLAVVDYWGKIQNASAYGHLYTSFDLAQSNKAAALLAASNENSYIEYLIDARSFNNVSNAVSMGMNGIAIPAYGSVAGEVPLLTAPLTASDAANFPTEVLDKLKDMIPHSYCPIKKQQVAMYKSSNGSLWIGHGSPPPGYSQAFTSP